MVQGDLAEVEALLAKGADVKADKSNSGTTPLHFAAEKGHAAIVDTLLAHGADVKAVDMYDEKTYCTLRGRRPTARSSTRC